MNIEIAAWLAVNPDVLSRQGVSDTDTLVRSRDRAYVWEMAQVHGEPRFFREPTSTAVITEAP